MTWVQALILFIQFWLCVILVLHAYALKMINERLSEIRKRLEKAAE